MTPVSAEDDLPDDGGRCWEEARWRGDGETGGQFNKHFSPAQKMLSRDSKMDCAQTNTAHGAIQRFLMCAIIFSQTLAMVRQVTKSNS